VANPTAEVAVRWLGAGLRFTGGASGRPDVQVDGDSEAAISPIELLLVSVATCAAADVVMILEKQRVRLASLDIAVRGTRRETPPRRFTAIAFHVAVRGEGADEIKTRRAIDLSLEKYCSVAASLAPDISISYDVTIA
jgi:putative redox protein